MLRCARNDGAGEWAAALAAYRAAEAEVLAFEGAHRGYSEDEAEAVEDRLEALDRAAEGAWRRMLAAAAPDVAALAAKIALVAARELAWGERDEAGMAALCADALRLAREEPRRPASFERTRGAGPRRPAAAG